MKQVLLHCVTRLILLSECLLICFHPEPWICCSRNKNMKCCLRNIDCIQIIFCQETTNFTFILADHIHASRPVISGVSPVEILTDTGENVQKWTRVFSTRRWVILVTRTRRKENSGSTFGQIRLRTSFESSPVSVNIGHNFWVFQKSDNRNEKIFNIRIGVIISKNWCLVKIWGDPFWAI